MAKVTIVVEDISETKVSMSMESDNKDLNNVTNAEMVAAGLLEYAQALVSQLGGSSYALPKGSSTNNEEMN